MAGITGDKFAVRLDMWLTYNGCKKNETPLITLTSCSTGADFKDKELITSFAEELSRTLYALGRENKIVCSTGLFSPSNRGVSLCFQLAYNSKDRVNAWQGFDRWLDPSFQKENGVEYLHGLTEGNRKTNLIRLVYTNKSGKTKNEERFKSFEESRNMYTLRELN